MEALLEELRQMYINYAGLGMDDDSCEYAEGRASAFRTIAEDLYEVIEDHSNHKETK